MVVVFLHVWNSQRAASEIHLGHSDDVRDRISTCSTDAVMDDAEMWTQQDLDDLDWEYERGLVWGPPPAPPPTDPLNPPTKDAVTDFQSCCPRPEAVWCDVCQLWQVGPMRDHLTGKKHRRNYKKIRAGEIMRIVGIMIARKFLMEREYRKKVCHVRTGIIVANRVARSMSSAWASFSLARCMIDDGLLYRS